MLGLCACSKLVFEGRITAGAIVCEQVAGCADPGAPVLRGDCALIRPVVACFVVRVAGPFVCIWA